VGLGVFIVVASARRQPNAVPPSIAAAPAPAPAPAPVAAPAPAPVAAPAPAPAVPPANTVTISIRTEPPGAEILLDDAPLPNPFSGSFPASDLRRRVVVKKQGYRPSASWEIFDRDRVLEVQLKAASGGVVGAPAPASAREKPPAQPPAVRSRPMHTDDVIIPEWEKDSAKKK
jgi:hypothetical protein